MLSVALRTGHLGRGAYGKTILIILEMCCNLWSKYNELLELQAENHLRCTKVPDANFILNSSALGNLNDSKSDSTINKEVQQMIINFSLCSQK